MRPPLLLLPLLSGLSGLSGTASATDLERRQDQTTDEASDPQPDPTTSEDPPTEAPTVTTEQPTQPDEPTTATTQDESDTTVTITRTVGGGDGSTETTRTTIDRTRTTTIVITRTSFETTTVTSRGQGTATKTEYVTTTVDGAQSNNANQRRWADEFSQSQSIPNVEATLTDDGAPAPTGDSLVDYHGMLEMAKRDAQARNHLAKRATITVTETTTAESGDDVTITDTITRTAVATATRSTRVTDLVTETEQADASTTVTTTVTRTETSVSTGISEPTTAPGDGSGDGDNSDSGGSGGLSTGAKAGIGAGVGVAGLLIIGGLAWFCLRKRREKGSKHDFDTGFGASEVPVGGAAAGAGAGAAAAGRHSTPPMSHSRNSVGNRLEPSLPNVAAEGYRGTAMGDGRAGYAKPDPYGAAYSRPSNNTMSPVSPLTANSRPADRTSTLASGDHLPEHSTPSDMSGGAAFAAGGARHTSPSNAAELGGDGSAARGQIPALPRWIAVVRRHVGIPLGLPRWTARRRRSAMRVQCTRCPPRATDKGFLSLRQQVGGLVAQDLNEDSLEIFA
jgi:hypothetical protein